VEYSVAAADSSANPIATHIDWTAEFHSTSDYWGFVEAAAAAAHAGDGRAQFLLAEALGECKGVVARQGKRYNDGMSPAEIFEETFWKVASRSVPTAYVEFSRRQFMKCARFFEGNPPALDNLGVGSQAHTRDYWLALALENEDPVASMQDAYLLAAKLDSVPVDSKQETLERIKREVSLAVESRDPEAMYRLAGFIALVGSEDAVELPAWAFAACESGYDCTYANPAIGKGCISLGLCSGGESITLNMQQDLGLLYGKAYARSQEIVYALEAGQARAVAEALLAKLKLED
jgi:hypothetical protein